jgi:hypothetical protein
MLEHLTPNSDNVAALQQTIADLDNCFLNGFVGGQYDILAALPHIFSGTPLQQRIQDSTEALTQNHFTEAHFVTLAAARTALQGALYDALREQALTALERPISATADIQTVPNETSPLLDSARHWLMELAMTGIARLEAGTVGSFATTLAQLRADPATASHAALLTGFLHEVMNALPIKPTDNVPLWRWCDLWSNAMLSAVGLAESPAPMLVSGTLYPLGVELRQHSRAASIVVYGILVKDGEAQFVRQTWSAFKATAIQRNDIWLMFPQAQTLLVHLLQGKALTLQDMPMLPSGDLLWNEDNAVSGKKYKLLEVALEHCGIGTTICVTAQPPLERHPIQLAEPIALTEYRVEENRLHLKDGMVLALDAHRSTLAVDDIAATTALFGLLRYDAGTWSVQALTAGNPIGKFEFVGQAGAELLKKPPKTSTVSILQERASRLLRKRANT